MSNLRQAFKLLRDFDTLPPSEQRTRIAKVDRFLAIAKTRSRRDLLDWREVDQLRKQRAYMLMASSRVDEGINEIESLVIEYEKWIADLHEEAAFQLAEAALVSFQLRRAIAGQAFARAALEHSGNAKRISRTVLKAIELMQREVEQNGSKSEKVKRTSQPKR